MKKRFVISNIPTKYPLNSTIIFAFVLDHFNVNAIWWGVFITLYSLYWILIIIIKWHEEAIDLNSLDLSDKEDEDFKSKFIAKLTKAMNENQANKKS